MNNFFGFYTQYEKYQTFKSFGVEHIIAMILVAIIISIATYYIGKLNKDKSYKLVKIFAILLPIVELSHTIWLIYCGQTDLKKLLPLHLCTLQVFFIPLAVFTRKNIFKDFIFVTSILGGMCGIVFPSGVADNYPFFHFQTIQTICYHSLLIYIPIALIRIGEHEPTIKRLKNSVVIFFIIGAIDYFVDSILNENYMFLAYPPAVKIIEDIYFNYGHAVYLIVMFFVLLIATTLIHIPFDIKNNKRKNKVQGSKNTEAKKTTKV